MGLSVGLTWQATSADLSLLREVLSGDVELLIPSVDQDVSMDSCGRDDLLRIAEKAKVLMGWIVPEDAINAAPELNFIQLFHAGVDHAPFDLLMGRGILLGNVSEANAVAVAEHAFALLLSLAKRVLRNHHAALELRPIPLWEPASSSLQIAGKTLVIVGTGHIGQEIAKRAAGFGMHVVGVRRGPGAAASKL
jgi:phosphoglycerate dehydrogenase-like enzyme